MSAREKAEWVIHRLVSHGHIAYFAGGWVRDFLLGKESDDIDIATSALPEQIIDLFPRTILVGLAFGVVIVPVDSYQFEVATFRKDMGYLDGRRPDRVEYSSAEEDAIRRDFTINGMFFDPIENVIYDFVKGQEDLKKGIIRCIGDPQTRFLEDRLRMVRAFRFSSRFDFLIEDETLEAIKENAYFIYPAVSPERIWNEFEKMAGGARFEQALIEMHRVGLLSQIFPELSNVHLNDIKNRTVILSHFPKNTPTILSLMELFPDFDLEKKIEIAKGLRVKNKDIDFIVFMEKNRSFLLNEEHEDVEWARFYANPLMSICLEVQAVRYKEKSQFLQIHKEKQKRLRTHIERMKEKKTLITSAHLLKEGVLPGIKMGKLIKEAERIAVNENIEQLELILTRLRPFIHE